MTRISERGTRYAPLPGPDVEPFTAVVVFQFFQEVGTEFGLQLVEVCLAEFADFGGVRGCFGGGRGFEDFL